MPCHALGESDVRGAQHARHGITPRPVTRQRFEVGGGGEPRDDLVEGVTRQWASASFPSVDADIQSAASSTTMLDGNKRGAAAAYPRSARLSRRSPTWSQSSASAPARRDPSNRSRKRNQQGAQRSPFPSSACYRYTGVPARILMIAQGSLVEHLRWRATPSPLRR